MEEFENSQSAQPATEQNNSGEGNELSKLERNRLKRQRKREDHRGQEKKQGFFKTAKIILTIIVLGVGVFALVKFFTGQPKLPPTSMQGHIESSPPAHIVIQPIPDNIQRHMLEHADGGGLPGVIIQYNCTDFECGPDLVEELTELVKLYPDNVYLAPNNYDGKIILTKLGKREILENFDEQVIAGFIGGAASSIQNIDMTSANLFFGPDTLTLTKNQPVIINFQNIGRHTFTIDELGVDIPLNGSSPTAEFTPTLAGTFEYYCAIPGHREGGMFGSLTVE